MTTRSRMQCLVCAHYRSPLDSEDDDAPEQTCDAFPSRIPDVIWGMQFDHRQPYPGDNGIQWESEGRPYPAEDLVLPEAPSTPAAPAPLPVMRASAGLSARTGRGIGWGIGWDPAQELCMPPKISVPKPGPCPGSKRGAAKSAIVKSPIAKARPKIGAISRLKEPKEAKEAKEPKAPKAAKTAAKTAAKRPTATASRATLKLFYGDRLHVQGRGAHINEHLQQLGDIPTPMHAIVARNLTRTPEGGIFLGTGGVTGLSREAKKLEGKSPTGWPPGHTWQDAAGAYSWVTKQILIGGGTVGHGSSALAAHEFGHALDDAGTSLAGPADSPIAGRGAITSREPWQRPWRTITADDGLVVHPYYTETGNPESGMRESFAETFGAWTKVRQAPDEMTKVKAILDAVANVKPGRPEGEYSPEVVAATKELIGIFEHLATYRERGR